MQTTKQIIEDLTLVMPQKDIAKSIGVHNVTITKWKYGNYNITMDSFQRLEKLRSANLRKINKVKRRKELEQEEKESANVNPI